MKKIFLAMLAISMLTGSAFATGGKKGRKAAKSNKCTKADCPQTCDKSKCVDMPCCK